MSGLLLRSDVPADRLRHVGDRPANTGGAFVLYWMIANRRTRYNFSLQRAVDWAKELKKPLVVFEALRAGYPWACDRIHAFVIQGMLDNAAAFSGKPVTYWPYLEPKPGDGSGALAALARQACVVISDDFPCFFLPRMVESAARQIPVRLELVDSNGLFPMRATERIFARAFDFRRHLQKNLLPHLEEVPLAEPSRSLKLPVHQLEASFRNRWPAADLDGFSRGLTGLKDFPINHRVKTVNYLGGSKAAAAQLGLFLRDRLDRYHEDRNQPEQEIASGLSPWLHFGHISAHDVFATVTRSCGWTPENVSAKVTGSNTGWWGAPPAVESFFDELITWRELGYNLCSHTDNYDQYESLPDWARATLDLHARDPRPWNYSPEQLEQSQTHDPLWNAAQVQLVREGRIHNYLRMLWGKKILEWSPSPREALARLIELNNKYATDGRNPNSYSGIFWVLGRYDRPWGPERPIYGQIRYMTSENTARKVKVRDYIRKYSKEPSARLFE
jgi:deoxyribodipyrimidine photo-lyase